MQIQVTYLNIYYICSEFVISEQIDIKMLIKQSLVGGMTDGFGVPFYTFTYRIFFEITFMIFLIKIIDVEASN